MPTVIGRLTNFVVDRTRGDLYAGDDRGLVYHLSPDLATVRRSAGTSHGVVIHAIALGEHHLYTRDVAGNVVQWDRDTLVPLNFLLTQHCVADAQDRTPVPSPSNVLVCEGDRLIVANALGTLSVLDARTLETLADCDATPDAFPERVTLHQGQWIVADVGGHLHRGRPETGFQPLAAVPGGVVHAVVPDPLHPRLWCTSDITGGVFFVGPEGGLQGELRFTNDDVEDIAFDSTGRLAYIGCFDHHVHVVENRPEPVVVASIGPFKFQVNHIALLDDRRLLVLLESGELNLVDPQDGRVLATAGGSNALWNFHLDGDRLTGAAEDGRLEHFRLRAHGSALALQRDAPGPQLGAGRLRALKPLGPGWVCGSADGSVMALHADGSPRWRVRLDGIVRDVDVDAAAGEVLVGTEVGEVVLLDAASGRERRRFRNGKPVWCVAFADDGGIVFGERTLMPAGAPREPSTLAFLARDMAQPPQRLQRFGNHKRLRRLGGHRMLVTGNGSIGVQIVDTRTPQVLASFDDWIINTPENAVVHDGRIHAVTYGYQLITYDLDSGRTLDVQFITEGYPTGLEVYRHPGGRDFLLLAGRNMVMSFVLGGDAPQLVGTRYLVDTRAADAHPAAAVSRRAPAGVLERTLRHDAPQAEEALA